MPSALTWEEFYDLYGEEVELTSKDYAVGLRILEEGNPVPNTGSNFIYPMQLLGTLYKKVNITAANFKTCGTIPVSVLTTPGAGKFLSPTRLIFKKAAGGGATDFDNYICIKNTSGQPVFSLPHDQVNLAGVLSRALIPFEVPLINNEPLIITTESGNDSTILPGALELIISYTIHSSL